MRMIIESNITKGKKKGKSKRNKLLVLMNLQYNEGEKKGKSKPGAVNRGGQQNITKGKKKASQNM